MIQGTYLFYFSRNQINSSPISFLKYRHLKLLVVTALFGLYTSKGWANYCPAGALNGTFERISNVKFNTINNSSTSTAGYEDFTAVSTTIEQGAPYTFTGTIQSPSSADKIIVWIDFNQDFDFDDPGEEVFHSPQGVGPHSGNIIIPNTATLGSTRMRVRLVWYAGTGGGYNQTPCGNSTWGQVEDYTVNIAACTGGTPNPGNTLSSVPPPVCTGGITQGFTLSMQNAVSEAVFQWQSSPDNSNWTNISGANFVTHYVSGIAATTWYRCQATNCSNSTASTPLQITTIGCYCAAGADIGTLERISNVQFNTINNSSTSTAGYEDFTAVSTTIEQGGTYTFTGTIQSPSSADKIIVWIDFNQNADFTDPGEEVFNSIKGVGPHYGNVTIPNTATLGSTRMRVRLVWYAGSGSAYTTASCGNSYRGQVEDYTVNIAACTGSTPNPGNTLSSVPPPVCTGGITQGFTLSMQNAVSGTAFQWQSSPDNSNWTNISGANFVTHYVSGIAATTWYRCQVTSCSNSTASTPLQITTIGCFCAAGADIGTQERISNVQFNTINNSSTSTAGYEDFTAVSTTIEQGATYTFTGTIQSPHWTDKIIVWIDFNQDFDFTDPGEEVFNSPQGLGPHSGNITIPNTATLGSTRMRVRLVWYEGSGSGFTTASCGNSYRGQVEDYTVHIAACTGSTPNPGNTLSSVPPPVCTGGYMQAFTLSMQNTTSGAAFQWQSSPDNINWTNISGANFATHSVSGIATTTWYRCQVTSCSNSTASTPLQITTVTCYCLAGAGGGELISKVQFNTINNPSTSTNGYENFTAISTTIEQEGTYTFTGNIQYPYSLDEIIVWIDYNQDLDFTDPGEEVFNSPQGGGPHSGNVTIPNTATLGSTRMRVRLVYGAENLTPCGNSVRGQVEDYSVNITPNTTKVWTGGGFGAWDVATNWTPTGVPTAINSVNIPSGIVEIPASVNAFAKQITMSGTVILSILSNATLDLDNALSHGINASGPGVSINNSGTINILKSGANSHGIFLSGGATLSNFGTISIPSTATIASDGIHLAGTNTSLGNSGTINILKSGAGSRGIFMSGGAILSNEGTISIPSTASIASDGIQLTGSNTSLTNQAGGAINIQKTDSRGIAVLADADLINHGVISIGTESAASIGAGALIFEGSGSVLTNQATGTIHIDKSGNNASALNVLSSASATNNGAINIGLGTNNPYINDDGIWATATFQNNGAITIGPVERNLIGGNTTNTFNNNTGGSIKGTGTIVSSVFVNVAGALKPGYSPGKITYNAAENFANSTMDMEVNGTGTAGTHFDQIVVSGTATLGGTLKVQIGYSPSENDQIILVSATALSGTFSSVIGLPANWYVLYNVPSNGKVSLRYQSTPLPIELVSFNGKVAGEYNHLSWTTATEANSKYHIIERSVTGREDWREIGSMDAAGFSDQPLSYEYYDKLPLPKAYYRLKSLDFDGQFQYSPIVVIERPLDHSSIVRMYPVPATDHLTLDLALPEPEPLTISILDAYGRSVLQQVLEAESGINTVLLRLNDLAPGWYVVQVDNGKSVMEKRFLKQ